MTETLAHFRHYHIPEHRAMPRVFVALEVRLGFVVDLTDAALRRRLRVSQRALLEVDWRPRGRGDALTQELARAAQQAGAAGLLAPSAARPGGINLIVFPDSLGRGDLLAVLPAGRP